MVIAAFVVSVAAFAAAVFSTWYTRASSRAATRQAVATEEQAIAARSQTEYAGRMLELAEEQASKSAFDEAKAHLVAQRVAMRPLPAPWSVWRTSKTGVSLANGSPRPLYDVTLSFDVQPARVEPTSWERVDERATVKVMILSAFGASPDAMTVRWRDAPDAELREWTTALP